jgi:hypothetical protein
MVSSWYRLGVNLLSEILTVRLRLILSGATPLSVVEVDSLDTSFTDRAKEAFEKNGLAKPVTKMAKLYGVLPEIEQMILAGRPGQEIREWLAASGLPLTGFTYKNYLARARRRKKKIEASAVPAPIVDLPTHSAIFPHSSVDKRKASKEPMRQRSPMPIPNSRVIRPEPLLKTPTDKLPGKSKFI